MKEIKMNQKFINILLKAGIISLGFSSTSVFAAQAINLRDKPVSVLQPFFSTSAQPNNNFTVNLSEKSRRVDFIETTHIRMQQYVGPYPVWGGDFILHVPQTDKSLLTKSTASALSTKHTTMNGFIYQNLMADLQNAPSVIFTDANKT